MTVLGTNSPIAPLTARRLREILVSECWARHQLTGDDERAVFTLTSLAGTGPSPGSRARMHGKLRG